MYQFTDFYALLDISSEASTAEILVAFDKEAKSWHPGRYPELDGRKVMQDIIEAKRILLDPVLRLSYDIEYNRLKANKELPPKTTVAPSSQNADEWLKRIISETRENNSTLQQPEQRPKPKLSYYYTVNEVLITGYDEQVVCSFEFRAEHSTLEECKNEANRFFEKRRKLIEYRISLGIYEVRNNQQFEFNIILVEKGSGSTKELLVRSITKDIPKENIDYQREVLKRYPSNVDTWINAKANISLNPGSFPGDQVIQKEDEIVFVDYYNHLEITPTATAADIESAYNRLSSKLSSSMWHPDWHEGKDTYKRTRQINEAYKVLSDPYLRAQYDLIYLKEKEAQRQKATENKEHDQYGMNLKTDNELFDIYVNAYQYEFSYIDACLIELGRRNYRDEQLHEILRSRKVATEVTVASHEEGVVVENEIAKPELSWLQKLKRMLFKNKS